MRTLLCLMAAGGLAACTIAACASDDDAPLPGANDAGSTVGDTDASEPDAALSDAAADAEDVDAAPKACSDDGFCPTVLPAKEVLRGVWGDGQGAVWAVSETGHVLRHDGTAWKIQFVGSKDRPLRGVWGSGPTDIWVLAENEVLHGTGSSPETLAFAPVTLPGDASVPLHAIAGTAANDVWVVGGYQDLNEGPFVASGRVLHYTGATWNLDDVSSEAAYSRVWADGESGVWIAGSPTTSEETNYGLTFKLQRRAKDGTTWETVALPEDPDPNAYFKLPGEISGGGTSGPNSVWIVGTTQSYNKAYWRGVRSAAGQPFTWTIEPRQVNDLAVTAFWGTSTDDTWAAGEYGRLRHWDGKTWTQARLMTATLPVVDPFYGIWGSTARDLWIVGENIALHKPAGTP